MDQIFYQSVCDKADECPHIKNYTECPHAKPLRRKESKGYYKTDSCHFEFACPRDSAVRQYKVAKCSCRKNEYIRWRAISHPGMGGFDGERSTELKKELSKKFNKCYGVFRWTLVDGVKRELCGYVEASFSMEWDSKRVMPVKLKEAESVVESERKYVLANKAKFAKNVLFEFFIVRLTSSGKKNPVVIDWNASKYRKYEWRNIPFKIRDSLFNDDAFTKFI